MNTAELVQLFRAAIVLKSVADQIEDAAKKQEIQDLAGSIVQAYDELSAQNRQRDVIAAAVAKAFEEQPGPAEESGA